MLNRDIPGYIQTHTWVAYHLGRPKECSACGFVSENSKQFNWANVSGLYERDLNDWVRLCVACHYAFDNTYITHCVNRHEFTEANTYFRPNGKRECRICKLESLRKFRRKKNG